ncbi:MAG: undecaprenyl-phosphate glucose phosphotransferase [Chitinophagaceae bacterium]|nr:MAG: undecaprenyl-phosphate glucose phosphotransferase [Chitinophagaceae bacterium]
MLRNVRIHIALLDTMVLNIAIITCEQIFQSKLTPLTESVYLRFYLFMNIAWVTLSLVFSLYKDAYSSAFEQFCRRSMNVYIAWSITIFVYLFFWRQLELSRLFITVNMGGFGLLILFNRFIFLTGTYPNPNSRPVKNVMILGYNDIAKKLAGYLEQETSNTRVVGFCDKHENVKELTHYPILSDVSGAMKITRQYEVNEIYSTISPEHNDHVYQIMQQADRECIRFKLIPDMSLSRAENAHLNYVKDMPVLSFRSEPLESTRSQYRKRVFDVAISLLVTVFILSWLIPVITLLIWLESKGPIFFIQMRSGKNNKPFPCIKFRSMHADHDQEARQATKNDDRLTRVGKFLRKTNLDEFPQFINVLRGEMSIVGPRPHMLEHTESYSKKIEQYMVRQFMKPGITGWAQVNGFRGETKSLDQMEKRVEHDLWYMENWSLWLDVRIIFMTIFNAIRGEENAF